MDTVRTVMLWLEGQQHWTVSPDWRGKIDGIASWPELVSYLKILDDAGFVDTKRNPKTGNPISWRLTWQGHEFISTIRDDEIWQKTKSKAAAIGGWSLKMMGDIATALLKDQFKSLTGLDLG